LIWWNAPVPPRRNTTFANLIEENPTSVAWHSDVERDLLIWKMSSVNRAKLEAARRAGRRMVGCVYKRTRLDERGVKVQRAEVTGMLFAL
jgi:DNA (cytosine-5)-methyltransferase 1